MFLSEAPELFYFLKTVYSDTRVKTGMIQSARCIFYMYEHNKECKV